MVPPATAGERTFRGIPASPGIARGRLLVVGHAHREVERRDVPESDTPAELDRLTKAIQATRRDLQEIQQKVAATLGSRDAEIFEAHLMVLDDVVLLDEIQRAICEQKVNAEHAVHTIIQRYADAIAQVDDDYLRERAVDVRDIGGRLIGRLLGQAEPATLQNLPHPCILVAHDLAPSQTALLDRSRILGIMTEAGGSTSHTAILARKLGIPAVVAIPGVVAAVHTGEAGLVDGHAGVAFVNPTDQTLFQYGQLQQRRTALEDRLRQLRDEPAITLDGRRIALRANIEEPRDLDSVCQAGAEGVGLFRTEYLFLNSEHPPDEEAQYQAYRTVAEACAPHGAVIRTLDLGGDKLLAGAKDHEPNPFLGWRAIRICLDRPDLFRTQLRALLRASAHGPVRILLPMISAVEEVIEAVRLVDQCKEDLRQASLPFDDTIQIGVMIEIPAAALIAGHLAAHVQFFSIGTNDLTGYTLAVDRMNERVARLYAPAHPAVLQLIHATVAAGRRAQRHVSVCGEAAGDPLLVPLLLGLGVEELSVTPASLPRVKHLIRRLRFTEAAALAEAALAAPSAQDNNQRCAAFLKSVAPELDLQPVLA